MITLKVDAAKKVFQVTASGLLGAEEVQNYLKELEENITKVDVTKFALVIDAREQKAMAPEAIPLLEKSLKLYTETPFAKRFSVVLESAIAMSQVKRVGKDEVGQFVMVSSLEEAYKNL